MEFLFASLVFIGMISTNSFVLIPAILIAYLCHRKIRETKWMPEHSEFVPYGVAMVGWLLTLMHATSIGVALGISITSTVIFFCVFRVPMFLANLNASYYSNARDSILDALRRNDDFLTVVKYKGKRTISLDIGSYESNFWTTEVLDKLQAELKSHGYSFGIFNASARLIFEEHL